MLDCFDFTPPDSLYPATGRVLSALAIGLGILIFVAMPLGAVGYDRWPLALLFTVLGWIGQRLCREVLELSVDCERDFEMQLRQARAELTLLADAKERKLFVAKWFIRICRQEAKIKAQYAERVRYRSWTQYLERRRNEGGATIMQWYEEPLKLLAMAKSLDATTSFSEYRKAQALDNLALARVTLVGEEQIAQAREQLRQDGEPRLPWEDLL